MGAVRCPVSCVVQEDAGSSVRRVVLHTLRTYV
jgi:hypothetical protein